MQYDMIIIGSGPAGLTAALYGCRAGYNVGLITGFHIGGTLSYINSIENFPGISNMSGSELAEHMLNQLQEYSNLRLISDEAKSVKKLGSCWEIECSFGEKYYSTSIVNAIGSVPRTLHLDGEDKFFGRGISFCATCDAPFYKDKTVAVVGGGATAVDFALSLSNNAKHVFIVVRGSQFKAPKIFLQKLRTKKNIDVYFNTTVSKIYDNIKSYASGINVPIITGIEVLDSKTNESFSVPLDGIFYALGSSPNQLNVLSSSRDGFFEAGDCIDTKYKQVITACGDGCKAALDAINYLNEV